LPQLLIWEQRVHTHQQAARQKLVRIGFAPQQKKGSDAFACAGKPKELPLAMAAAVFICLQFFYDTLDSLELNTTRLIFTLMAVKTRAAPPPTNHGIQRIKNMTSAALWMRIFCCINNTHRGNSLRAQTQLAWESA
jgi:hypothetical protein